MWKTKLIIVLIVSTTANAVTNADDTSLTPCADDEACPPGISVAQDASDLGREYAPTMLHQEFLPVSGIHDAPSEIGGASDLIEQERLAVVS